MNNGLRLKIILFLGIFSQFSVYPMRIIKKKEDKKTLKDFINNKQWSTQIVRTLNTNKDNVTQASFKIACQKKDDTTIKLYLGQEYVKGHTQKEFIEKYKHIPEIIHHISNIPTFKKFEGDSTEKLVYFQYSLVQDLIKEAKECDISLEAILQKKNFTNRLTSIINSQLNNDMSMKNAKQQLHILLKDMAASIYTRYYHYNENDLIEYIYKAIRLNNRAHTSIAIEALQNYHPHSNKQTIFERLPETSKKIIQHAFNAQSQSSLIICDLVMKIYGNFSKFKEQKCFTEYVDIIKKNQVQFIPLCAQEILEDNKKTKEKNKQQTKNVLFKNLNKNHYIDIFLE